MSCNGCGVGLRMPQPSLSCHCIACPQMSRAPSEYACQDASAGVLATLVTRSFLDTANHVQGLVRKGPMPR
eukprot:scaffold4482_cov133-Isochrysis_galbana.AAC.7